MKLIVITEPFRAYEMAQMKRMAFFPELTAKVFIRHYKPGKRAGSLGVDDNSRYTICREVLPTDGYRIVRQAREIDELELTAREQFAF